MCAGFGFDHLDPGDDQETKGLTDRAKSKVTYLYVAVYRRPLEMCVPFCSSI